MCQEGIYFQMECLKSQDKAHLIGATLRFGVCINQYKKRNAASVEYSVSSMFSQILKCKRKKLQEANDAGHGNITRNKRELKSTYIRIGR